MKLAGEKDGTYIAVRPGLSLDVLASRYDIEPSFLYDKRGYVIHDAYLVPRIPRVEPSSSKGQIS